MVPKILIIGATGKLGIKLINYCFRNEIKINTITCYKNSKKIRQLQKKNDIKNTFSLIESSEKLRFKKFLKFNKFNLIYFLDYGSFSLEYLDIILKNNSSANIAIANKEMIIAGGKILIKMIYDSGNSLIPLDSEHFSLKNTLNDIKNIKKIFITASGGPLFFTKYKNFNNVELNEVLSHPKWKMGINNLIDSSNFINKILEIYELSYIYDIPLKKIDFIISKSAFIHSIIEFNDGILTFNAFKNDMLLTLVYPLSLYFDIKNNFNSKNLMMNNANFELTNNIDKRFNFFKFFNIMKKFNHLDQINLLLLNNLAQSLYLSNKIKYNEIIPFIFKNIKKYPSKIKFSSLNEITKYIINFNNVK